MAKPGFITRQGSSCYYQRTGGAGNFLTPPGDAQNSYHIEEERGGVVTGIMSLEYAAHQRGQLPLKVKLLAIGLLRQYRPQYDEAWVHSVYNYFRNCYSPDGVDRNASRCIVAKVTVPQREYNPEHHLAVLHIRQWFPDHEPRMDLIETSGPLGMWHKGEKINA